MMARTALVLAAATVTTTASLAAAQTVESFDRLALLVNQRDHITVTDRTVWRQVSGTRRAAVEQGRRIGQVPGSR